jgi:ethanolamine ammonia-lyase small subunit
MSAPSPEPESLQPDCLQSDSLPPASGRTVDFWSELRRSTQSRIGLGRAGDGMPTGQVLDFRRSHALARDAVHDPLDVDALIADLTGLAGRAGSPPGGLDPAVVVTSRAGNRAEYLRRPDLGRLPADLGPVPRTAADVGFVLCDGLSARALQTHGAPLLAALAGVLAPELRLAPPVIATQARVALGDHIGAALGVGTVIVLIGERPGLSVADSLGVYLTHRPEPGRSDADRNCVSNIHPPEGLGYSSAALVVRSLVLGARALGRSGVDLKDSSRTTELPASPPRSDGP